MNANRQRLLNFYMDNPCLSEEIDYLLDEERLVYYTAIVNKMTEVEVIQELNNLEEYYA
jgi:hypothetical protein